MSDDDEEKPKIQNIFEINEDSFLGTGMSFAEFIQKHDMAKFVHSFFSQRNEEKKRRVRAVADLGAELQKIRIVSKFCSMLGELAIEAVIEGDWTGAGQWAGHFTFIGEDENVTKTHGPLWAEFVRILRDVIDMRPRDDDSTSVH